MLSAIFYGLRISLAVGVISTVLALAIGLAVGLAAAYFGGRVEMLIMRIVDIQLVVSVDPDRADPARGAGAGHRQDHHRAGDGAVGVLRAHRAVSARWSRSARNTSRPRAAWRCRRPRIVFRHLLPNCLPPLIVVATVQVAHGDRARGDAVLPRPRPADHRAVAGPADRQRLPVPAVRQILDQLLPGPRAAADDRQHQSRRRPVARRAQSAAAAMSRRGLSSSVERPAHAFLHQGRASSRRSTTCRSRVDRGEVLGLVGESGSGKSMTGYSIMGLIDPPGRIVAGRILLERRDLRDAAGGGDARSCAATASR